MNTLSTLQNRTSSKLQEGFETIITVGNYRCTDDLFHSIWFFDDVHGVVVGDGDNGSYDYILGQKQRGQWVVLDQSDCSYGSSTKALGDLINACEKRFGFV